MVSPCSDRGYIVSKRKENTLRRGTGSRSYRPVCWISAEGTTEKDYFQMSVFSGAAVSVKFVKDIHPSRRDPRSVLKRLKKALRDGFRKEDVAWLVVDVDDWGAEALDKLSAWAKEDQRYHLAVSNPKFELFLVMHFGKGKGCTTSERVDAELKKYLPTYNKRLSPSQFSLLQVEGAVKNAYSKRRGCVAAIPDAGMTDVHQLVEFSLQSSNS